MKATDKRPTTIDEYIAEFPTDIQERLMRLRATIHEAAPDATEAIKYRMPTFVLNGNLVHFAAHTNHIGFYPTPSAIEEFGDELSRYQSSKGAVQLPLSEPLPLSLIDKIVRFRVKEVTG